MTLRRLCASVLVGVMTLASAAVPVGVCEPGTAAEGAERVAVINWGLAQTLIALDVGPVAVAGADGYRNWVAEPPLPATSIDIGRRMEPNLTVLASAKPSVILMSSFYVQRRRTLERIAPVATLDIYEPGARPLQRAGEVARCLARRFGRQEVLKRLEADFDAATRALSRAAGDAQSVYVVQFRDADHVRVYGNGSLFGGVLERAGMDNAWDAETNFWGFSTTAFTDLDQPAGRLIVVGPVPHEAKAMTQRSPIWRALPAVRDGRVHTLEPVWAYGGLTSAIRFAELLEESLLDSR